MTRHVFKKHVLKKQKSNPTPTPTLLPAKNNNTLASAYWTCFLWSRQPCWSKHPSPLSRRVLWPHRLNLLNDSFYSCNGLAWATPMAGIKNYWWVYRAHLKRYWDSSWLLLEHHMGVVFCELPDASTKCSMRFHPSSTSTAFKGSYFKPWFGGAKLPFTHTHTPIPTDQRPHLTQVDYTRTLMK